MKKHIEVGQIANLLGVYSNTDTTEGRGSRVLLHVCEDFATAEVMAEGKGVMGTKANIEPVHIIKANDGSYWLAEKKVDVISSREDYLRKRALAKLTDTDMKVLGLKK